MAPIKKSKRERDPHFFRAWREKKGLTQEQAMTELEWSQSKISRLESNVTPFNQDDMAAAAEAYDCTPLALIAIDPSNPDELAPLLVRAQKTKDVQRRTIISLLKAGLGDV